MCFVIEPLLLTLVPAGEKIDPQRVIEEGEAKKA